MTPAASGTLALPEQSYGDLIPRATIDGIIRAVADRFAPEKIILFGSYASDHPTPDSDLDLLVVMESDQPRRHRAAAMQLMFRPMPCSIDFLVFTPAEVEKWNGTVNHLITEAFRNGKIVYERNR